MLSSGDVPSARLSSHLSRALSYSVQTSLDLGKGTIKVVENSLHPNGRSLDALHTVGILIIGMGVDDVGGEAVD